MRLTKGNKYLVDALKFTGWTNADGSDCTDKKFTVGHNWADYFKGMEYIGPDKYGIEPEFALDTVQNYNLKCISDLIQEAKCALADLEGIMPEFEPSGDRTHPAWTTITNLRNILENCDFSLDIR
jgi:hypothetical protein